MQTRRSTHVSAPTKLRLTPMERAAWVVARVAISEARRRDRLAKRADAAERVARAEEKRAKRRAKARLNADCTAYGLAESRWCMGSHW